MQEWNGQENLCKNSMFLGSKTNAAFIVEKKGRMKMKMTKVQVFLCGQDCHSPFPYPLPSSRIFFLPPQASTPIASSAETNPKVPQSPRHFPAVSVLLSFSALALWLCILTVPGTWCFSRNLEVEIYCSN